MPSPVLQGLFCFVNSADPAAGHRTWMNMGRRNLQGGPFFEWKIRKRGRAKGKMMKRVILRFVVDNPFSVSF